MTPLPKPLHVATIRGHQLRFFRTPNNDGRPDMPWHCCEDLYRCMGLTRDMRKHFQRQMKSGPFRNDFKMVAIPDGIVTIAPHYVAQGITGTWDAIGCANIENEYAQESEQALRKLTAGLVFPDQVLPWVAAALKRHDEVDQKTSGHNL